MEDAIGPSLFKPLDGGVHRLAGSGEGASGQHFDLLRVSNFIACLDDFLSSFEELLSEVSELYHLAFDERVSQLLYRSINDGLIRVFRLENPLTKGVEG